MQHDDLHAEFGTITYSLYEECNTNTRVLNSDHFTSCSNALCLDKI